MCGGVEKKSIMYRAYKCNFRCIVFISSYLMFRGHYLYTNGRL